MALPSGLLEAVRNYLDISWVDADGDTKLTGIIARGMKYLDSVAGKTLDYTIEDKPRELLMDYCRYVRSNALDEFQTNYLSELLSLQIQMSIKTALRMNHRILSSFSTNICTGCSEDIKDSPVSETITGMTN